MSETFEDDSERVAARTRAWVERFVVGLGLCPFARAPLEAGTLEIRVCLADDPAELLVALDTTMQAVLDHPQTIETALLVHPNCLGDFDAYNTFLDRVDALLELRGRGGVLQVASFHPDYRFADAPADDPANATNRSPYPMLHVIREASVTAAVESHPDIADVPARNVALLRSMSHEKLRTFLESD